METPSKNIVLDPTNNHFFNVPLAIMLGVPEAIIFQNLVFWIKTNKANERNFRDGRYWTYNSVKAYSEVFPYFKKSTIRRVLESLEEKGLIMTGDYNEDRRDRTKWYALSDYGYTFAPSARPDFSQQTDYAPVPPSKDEESNSRKVEMQGENEKKLEPQFQKSGNAIPVFRNSPYICTDVKHTDKDRESKGCAWKTKAKRKSDKARKEEKKAHGEFGNVLLTDVELARLQERFPNDWNDRIANLSEYMASTGKAYKSHYATILTWARKDRERRQGAAASGSAPKKSGKTNAATKPQPSPSPAAESGDAAAYAELSEEEWLAGIADRHVSSAELKGRCPWLDEEEVVRLCRYFAMPWRELRQEGVEELESRIKAHNASLADK